jgi:hypothetical protein
MKLEKFSIQACCGKTSTIYKTDRPLVKDFLNVFKNLGFVEAEHFTKAGILYVESKQFIITGPFGSDRLQIKCKTADCDGKLKEIEALIQQF